jgi:signal peptidase I
MTRHRTGPPRRLWPWAPLGDLLVVTLTTVAAVVFIALGVGPHVLGYRTLAMLSGSIRPTASPGDLLVVRPEPVSAVRIGQIITFIAPLPGSPVVSHRVVMVEHDAIGTVIHTRGDANAVDDAAQLRLKGDTAWHVVRVVPGLGRLVGALHQPGIRLVTVWLFPLWICLDALRLLRPRRPARRRPDHGVRRATPVRQDQGRVRQDQGRGRAAGSIVLRTVACAIILTLGLPSEAVAGFSTVPPPPSATYASSTLQPVSSPGGSCVRNGGPTATATVTWTASPSSFSTGYAVSWTGGSTGSATTTASPLTVPGLSKNANYVFTIVATYQNWTSTAQATPTISC